MLLYTLLGSMIAGFIFAYRKDVLFFVFSLVSFVLFYLVPIYYVVADADISIYAEKSIEMALVFFFGLTVSQVVFSRGRFPGLQLSTTYSNHEYYIIYSRMIVIGILMKIAGGDLLHSSVFTFPWANPILYGISDRFFQVGVGLAFLSAMANGLNKKNSFFILIIVLLSLLGGSRITLIIPLSLLLILYLSGGEALAFIKGGVVGLIVVFFVIGLIGHLRTDEVGIDFFGLLDIVLFRLAEFYWPARLVELLDSGSVEFNIGWAFSGLLGMVPAGVSQLVTGTSIFQRDTNLLIELDIGSEFMSVPLTVIGEGYYWSGLIGVLCISFLCGILFFILRLGLNLSRGMVRLILFIQLYRFVFVLPVAAYPELVSLATKDLVFSLVFSFIVVRVFGVRSIAVQSTSVSHPK